jgi:hypothetical protein
MIIVVFFISVLFNRFFLKFLKFIVSFHTRSEHLKAINVCEGGYRTVLSYFRRIIQAEKKISGYNGPFDNQYR